MYCYTQTKYKDSSGVDVLLHLDKIQGLFRSRCAATLRQNARIVQEQIYCHTQTKCKDSSRVDVLLDLDKIQGQFRSDVLLHLDKIQGQFKSRYTARSRKNTRKVQEQMYCQIQKKYKDSSGVNVLLDLDKIQGQFRSRCTATSRKNTRIVQEQMYCQIQTKYEDCSGDITKFCHGYSFCKLS